MQVDTFKQRCQPTIFLHFEKGLVWLNIEALRACLKACQNEPLVVVWRSNPPWVKCEQIKNNILHSVLFSRF